MTRALQQKKKKKKKKKNSDKLEVKAICVFFHKLELFRNRKVNFIFELKYTRQ